MFTRRLLLFCLLAGSTSAPALAQPTAAPAASPVPGPVATIDPTQTARARAEFDAWRVGTIDRSHYDAQLNAKIPEGGIGQLSGQLRTLGDVVSFSQLERGTDGGSTYYVYKIVGSVPPPLAMFISFDGTGKIDAIAFRPLTPASPSPAPSP
jgi:hypothetical protein